MVLSVPLATVNAIEYEVDIYTEMVVPENRLPASNGSSDIVEQYLGNKYDDFKEYVRNQLMNCNEQINISSYNIPYTEAYKKALGNIVWDAIPEAFHVSNSMGFSISGSGSNKKFSSLNIVYNYTKAQYDKMYSEVESASSEILSGISGNTTLTDVQKALLIHDRLAILCEYDTRSVIASDSYTMYGALAKEVAVCQGYAEAYMYMLEKVGINSYLCSSDALVHAWNIVEIGGKYYHVDVTWDDPVKDIIGRVNHTNFLLSTNGIKASGHKANDFDTTPTSTTFDNYFWRDSETEFQLIGNTLYYIDDDEYLKTYNGKELCSVQDIWYTGNGGYYWVGNYSRLSSDGKDLLFSKSDAVYKYDVSNGKTEKVFTPQNSYGRAYNIYGFKYDDGKLVCEIKDTPDDTNNRYIVTGDYVNTPVIYTLSYDANGGSVSPSSEEVTEGTSVTLPTPAKSYKITYNANGGSNAPSEQTVSLTCKGWSENKTATSASYYCGTAYKPTASVTLYAVWNSGANVTVKSGTPVRSGYTFLGWSESKTATTPTYKSGEAVTVSSDKTLYAVWEKIPVVYTLNFDANGGSVTPTSAEVTEGSSVTLPTPTKSYKITYNANGGSNVPSEQTVSITCKGWSAYKTATSATYNCGKSYKLGSSGTIYAIWNSSADATVKSGTPVRSGYTFLGWSENSSAVTATYQSGDEITVSSNKTLYAVWSRNKSGFIVKTFAANADDNSVTTLEFFKEGAYAATYIFELKGSGEHQLPLDSIGNGDYIVVISKKNHVSKTCEITIDSAHQNFDLQINLLGDINGDGKVNTIDVARANAHAKGVNKISGYDFQCCNINGDGNVNTVDVARINAHAKGVRSLW